MMQVMCTYVHSRYCWMLAISRTRAGRQVERRRRRTCSMETAPRIVHVSYAIKTHSFYCRPPVDLLAASALWGCAGYYLPVDDSDTQGALPPCCSCWYLVEIRSSHQSQNSLDADRLTFDDDSARRSASHPTSLFSPSRRTNSTSRLTVTDAVIQHRTVGVNDNKDNASSTRRQPASSSRDAKCLKNATDIRQARCGSLLALGSRGKFRRNLETLTPPAKAFAAIFFDNYYI